MGQEQEGLGLREAARKYSVDAQTIRYWIKQGWVQVLQEPAGPGRPMLLEESSVGETLRRYRPHRDRVGRPLAGVVLPPSPPPPMPTAGGRGWGEWRRLAVAAAVGTIMLVLLMLPTAVFGLGATLTPSKDSYLLGETVSLTSTVDFSADEATTIKLVELTVTGAQGLDAVKLPVDPGAFTTSDISNYPTYSSDPDGSGPIASGDPIGTLTGTVTHSSLYFPFGYGYGGGVNYGYGYTLAGVTGKITYVNSYTPPVKKFPAPDALAPDFTAPSKLFGVPGGGGPGGGPTSLDASKMFDAPGVPGAPFGSTVLDIAYNGNNDAIAFLLDGNTNDIVAEVDKNDGFLYGFSDTGEQFASALAYDNQGNQWIIKSSNGTPAGQQSLKKVAGGSSFHIEKNGQQPSSIIKALTLDTFSGNLIASEEQTDPTGQVTIWEMNTNQMQVVGKFEAPAGPTQGGYTGLITVPGEQASLLGGYGNKAAQVEPNSGFVISTYPINNQNDPGLGFEVAGFAFTAGTIYMANALDGSVYSATPPAAGAAATNLPRAIAKMKGSGVAASMVVINGSSGNDIIVQVRDSANNAGTVVSISGGYTVMPGPPAVTGFYAPSNSVESAGYVHPKLYVVDNSASPPQVKSLDVTDATAVAATATAGGWVTVATLPNFVADIGGMAVRGGKLRMGELNGSSIHTLDPATGTFEGSVGIFTQGMGMMPPNGVEALTFVSSTINPAGTSMYVLGDAQNRFFNINAVPGAEEGKVLAVTFTGGGNPPFRIKGLTISGSGTVMAADEDTTAIYTASLPGTPAPEDTVYGSYTAALKVTELSGTETTSTAGEYDMEKVSSLTVTIAEPLPNQGYKAADLTGGKVTIAGTINDPTVTQVAVLADLPSAVLIGYDEGDGKAASTFTATADQAQYATNGLWHFTTAADAAIHDPWGPNIQSHNHLDGTYAYFGQNETTSDATSKPNFCQTMPGMPVPPGQTKCMVPDFMQQASSGYFDTPTTTLSGSGEATLAFDIWWEVETAADWDNLKLKSCEGTPGSSGASCDTLAQFAAKEDMPGNFAAGAVVACNSIGGYPACGGGTNTLIVVPNAKSGGSMTSVSFTLASALAGTKFFRFEFDSVDPFGNHFTGILLDNISVSGAGSLTLAAATIDKTTDPPSWTLLMKPEEGSNKITISASHTSYVSGGLTATADATFFLDTQAPTLTMAAMDDVTATSSLTVSGTFVEGQPKVIEIFKTIASGSSTVTLSVGKITTFDAGETAFSKGITLSEGSNKIEVRIKDNAGQCNTTTATDCTTAIVDYDTVTLDTTSPVITVGETAYPVGFVSARSGDLTVFQVDCADAAGYGISTVKAALPGTSSFTQNFRTDIPGAVKDQWLSGITGGSSAASGFLLPMTIPDNTPPGTLSLSVQCTDTAGNTQLGTVSASMVSTLAGFVLNLMPGDNLVSLPIIPTVASDTTLEASIDTIVAGVLSPVDSEQAIEKILYYDATDTSSSQADRWTLWTAVSGDTNSLTTMRTGRGYLVQMRAAAFKASETLAEGVPATPAPIALRYLGTFLKGGQSVPPVYDVEGTGGAWNLIGLHSEDAETVTNYFQPLESPNRIWGSALKYQNEISFPLEADATPTVVLGAFVGLVSSDKIEPGTGIWIFAVSDGSLVPR